MRVISVVSVWAVELIRLLGKRRLHPLTAECPFCHRMVRLHYNKAGRQHMFAHARALYEGSRFGEHRVAKARCVGSGKHTKFDPHPNERQCFGVPKSLLED